MPSPLAQLQHIVVVMLENRSFDNMLGFLYADKGNVPPLQFARTDCADIRWVACGRRFGCILESRERGLL